MKCFEPMKCSVKLRVMRSIDQLQSLFDEILQQILESIVLVALSLVRVSVFVLEVL